MKRTEAPADGADIDVKVGTAGGRSAGSKKSLSSSDSYAFVAPVYHKPT